MRANGKGNAFHGALSRREFLAGVVGSGAMLAACSSIPPKQTLPADLTQMDLAEAAQLVNTRQLSPVDLVKACLDRIDRVDPKLNSFITVLPERALAQARHAESEIASGNWRGPMHGIPIGIKDNIDTAGIKTTAASAVFADRVPTVDAEVVSRLKEAGAIIIGKLNMHEFATGTTSAISNYGAVHNPWHLEHIAGGSSGGNGAAIAAGLCFGSVGTDTGGSVRIPASCCGVVGLKPTYDVVDTKGLVFISRSFDHIGPMCRTVNDTALMFAAMSGHPVAQQYEINTTPSVSGLRVGILSGQMPICDIPIENEVQQVFNAAVEVVKTIVADVREITYAVPDHLGEIIDAEDYSFGISREIGSAGIFMPNSDSKQMSPEKYAKLKLELDSYRTGIASAFNEIDLVIVPTLPGLPLKIDDAEDPFALNACTFAFSIGGLPSISIPCGFSASGLPIGMLISGPPLSDARVLSLAKAFESETDWHQRRPVLI